MSETEWEPPAHTIHRRADTEAPNISTKQPDQMHGRRAWIITLLVMVVGLAATLLLSFGSRANYEHNEQRLTTLQTRLSGQLIAASIQQLGGQLDRVVGLTAESAEPVATFDRAIAPLMKPTGQFNSVVLVLVNGSPTVLQHVGAIPIKDPSSPVLLHLYARAAHSMSLIVNRVVAGRLQRFGYLVSARGPAGIYVIAAGSELPSSRHVTLPASSPDSALNFALYYGTRPSPGALIETNAPQLPIQGTVATEVVGFGSQHLTLVAAPRVALAGAWSENLAWVVFGLGILLTLAIGIYIRRLVLRRSDAEEEAEKSQRLYDEQRELSKDLQIALLPKQLPTLDGVEISARYLPATRGLEVGGDWYSAIGVDDNRFAFVVGDVSGHGLRAATVMAQLRFTVRALAKLGLSPAAILEQADSEIDVLRDDHYATALVGVVDLQDSICTFAVAGHPLPLVLNNGRCEQLDFPVGPPLGLHGLPFMEHRVSLPRGSTLVAFTDGLIERRGEDLQVSIERLQKFLASHPAGTAVDTLEQALKNIADDGHEDDIAVIAIRILSEASPSTIRSEDSGGMDEGSQPLSNA